jgi:5S rRNA maturation endonuclease (ribonuclease M5)
MAAVRTKHLKLLEPYLASEVPSIRGEDRHRELDMHCPLHDDTKRSATLDLDKGLWYCQAGCGGGRVVSLIRQREDWVDPPAGAGARHSNGANGAKATSKPQEVITEAKVKGWVESLQSNPARLEEIMAARGLEHETLLAYEIGWDRDRSAYTIPVRDTDGSFLNLRRYQLNPPDDRRKIWSVNGMGQPRLYPMSVLVDDDPEEIIVCEGEWDALLTIQQGFFAITRTASATTWLAEWGEFFKGKTVYLCHDADVTGQNANKKVGELLRHVCEVKVLDLPYEVRKKNGKDLTDYWLEGHTEEDFRELLDKAHSADPALEVTELNPEDANVLDAFDSRRVGEPLRVTVTIKGKRDPGYTIPKKFNLTCTRDAGHKCNFCPLNAAEGSDTLEVGASNPMVLELIESTKAQIQDAARRTYGIPKCTKLQVETVEHQAVEVLFARPSVEHSAGNSDEYKNIKITSVGRHDTRANNTVRVVGALHPEPRKQKNEFLAWEVDPIRTSLDEYEITPKDAPS